jgi:hypothetical protein
MEIDGTVYERSHHGRIAQALSRLSVGMLALYVGVGVGCCRDHPDPCTVGELGFCLVVVLHRF